MICSIDHSRWSVTKLSIYVPIFFDICRVFVEFTTTARRCVGRYARQIERLNDFPFLFDEYRPYGFVKYIGPVRKAYHVNSSCLDFIQVPSPREYCNNKDYDPNPVEEDNTGNNDEITEDLRNIRFGIYCLDKYHVIVIFAVVLIRNVVRYNAVCS